MSSLIERTVKGLKENGFQVVQVQTAQQAREYLMGAIAEGTSVGVGGSVSVREVGILPQLEEKGCKVWSHWGIPADQVAGVQHSAREADVYLCSANAVTADGRLVLLDGRGNRVSAVSDGPHDVYFIVSHSKIVEGGLDAAYLRIKQVACPQNARRLGLQTPCALTGKCSVKDCEKTSCCLTLVVDHAPHIRNMTVVLVEEKLGY